MCKILARSDKLLGGHSRKELRGIASPLIRRGDDITALWFETQELEVLNAGLTLGPWLQARIYV